MTFRRERAGGRYDTIAFTVFATLISVVVFVSRQGTVVGQFLSAVPGGHYFHPHGGSAVNLQEVVMRPVTR